MPRPCLGSASVPAAGRFGLQVGVAVGHHQPRPRRLTPGHRTQSKVLLTTMVRYSAGAPFRPLFYTNNRITICLKSASGLGYSIYNVKELLGAAILLGLDRRAFYAAVAAEYAAVARPGLEHSAAALAVIEKLAGIGRHCFDGLMVAFRTSQRRFKLHQRFARTILSRGRSNVSQLAAVTTSSDAAARTTAVLLAPRLRK